MTMSKSCTPFNDPDDGVEICPYNFSHRVPKEMIEEHMDQCEKLPTSPPLVKCVFNHLHRVHAYDKKDHEKWCDDNPHGMMNEPLDDHENAFSFSAPMVYVPEVVDDDVQIISMSTGGTENAVSKVTDAAIQVNDDDDCDAIIFRPDAKLDTVSERISKLNVINLRTCCKKLLVDTGICDFIHRTCTVTDVSNIDAQVPATAMCQPDDFKSMAFATPRITIPASSFLTPLSSGQSFGSAPKKLVHKLSHLNETPKAVPGNGHGMVLKKKAPPSIILPPRLVSNSVVTPTNPCKAVTRTVPSPVLTFLSAAPRSASSLRTEVEMCAPRVPPVPSHDNFVVPISLKRKHSSASSTACPESPPVKSADDDISIVGGLFPSPLSTANKKRRFDVKDEEPWTRTIHLDNLRQRNLAKAERQPVTYDSVRTRYEAPACDGDILPQPRILGLGRGRPV